MVHYISASMKEWGILATPWRDDYEGCKFYSPAWSLHRLIELRYGTNWIAIAPKIHIERVYDDFIDAIEEGIKEGYFNKEYLV